MRLRDAWKWLKAEYRWRVRGEKYEIVMPEKVRKQLDLLPEDVQAEIMKAMERIARNPYSGNHMRVTKEEYERLLNGMDSEETGG